MSLTLLKQSLDILEQDNSGSNNTSKLKEGKKTARAKQKQQWRDERKDNRIRKISDIRQEISQSTQKSKENLRRLLMLSNDTTLKNDDAVKIVKRAHKGRYVDVEIPKKEVESVFTEEDFRAFEEEYFKS